MGKISIYALKDPRTDKIRYVGKTNQSLKARISAHFMDKCKCLRIQWMGELKSLGLRPVFIILESLESETPWQDREIYWIAKMRSLGADLTNSTSGGEGTPNLPKETRERMRKTWLGRKHTPESIMKLKKARALRVTSDETRAKMSQSQTGRKITWIGKIAEANRKIDKETHDLIIKRIHSGEKVCELAKEYKMHRTSISKIKSGTYFVK
jgi:hypothetical protein